MSRRVLLVIIAVAVILLGLGGWWFSAHFHKVPVKHYEPPGQAAQDNHYLALERFMSRMGRGMTSSGDVRLLDKLKPGGVLILDRHHRAALNKQRLKELFDWVGKGGYLIVVPEYSDEPDPVMSYLHVQWDDDSDESCDDCGVPAAKGAKPAAPHPASSPAAASPRAASAPAPASGPTASPLTTAARRPANSPLTASAPAAAAVPRPASDSRPTASPSPRCPPRHPLRRMTARTMMKAILKTTAQTLTRPRPFLH